MENDQILDSGLKEITIPRGDYRWKWHLKHTGLILLLYLIVLFLLECILPYLPRVISGLLNPFLGIVLILGSYFITGYVSRTGYKWSWGAVLAGASFIFFSSFIYAMVSLDHWTEICAPKLRIWTSMSDRTVKKVLEILLVGVIYSCVSIVLVEMCLLLTGLVKVFYRLVKKV